VTSALRAISLRAPRSKPARHSKSAAKTDRPPDVRPGGLAARSAHRKSPVRKTRQEQEKGKAMIRFERLYRLY
jgi:hypothetical protein